MKTNNIDLVKIVEEVWEENELQSGVYKVAALTAMQKLQDIYEENPTGEGQSTEYVSGSLHIDFAVYLTGHDKATIQQMYKDWKRYK